MWIKNWLRLPAFRDRYQLSWNIKIGLSVAKTYHSPKSLFHQSSRPLWGLRILDPSKICWKSRKILLTWFPKSKERSWKYNLGKHIVKYTSWTSFYLHMSILYNKRSRKTYLTKTLWIISINYFQWKVNLFEHGK